MCLGVVRSRAFKNLAWMDRLRSILLVFAKCVSSASLSFALNDSLATGITPDAPQASLGNLADRQSHDLVTLGCPVSECYASHAGTTYYTLSCLSLSLHNTSSLSVFCYLPDLLSSLVQMGAIPGGGVFPAG